MKTRLLTLALFIAAAVSGFAQDKRALQEATERVINFKDQNDFNSMADATYPKIYEFISHEAYIEELKKSMKGEGYTIYNDRTDPAIDYGSITEYDEGYYNLFYYSYMLKVALDQKVAPKDQEATLTRFKKLLGTEDVYFNEGFDTLYVKGRKRGLAIADRTSDYHWTFLFDTDASYTAQALHEDVRNGLNPDYVKDESSPSASNSGKPAKTAVQQQVDKAAKEKAILEQKQNGKKKN